MSTFCTEFHKIWMEQCAAAEDIRDHFGPTRAMDYLIGEKLQTFVMISERDAAFAGQLPAFVAEIQRLFTCNEIRGFLNYLEKSKYLAPSEPESFDDPNEPWPGNPIRGAEELLRFSRVRQLLLEA